MKLVPGEEQTLLRDALTRWLAERHPFARRAAVVTGDEGFSREQWREFGELGWLAAGLPEEAGGLGGGPVDHMVVAECLGRSLWGGPWLDTAVMAADLLAGAGTERARELLEALLAGRAVVSCAFTEPASAPDPASPETLATRTGDGWRLAGRKSFVAWAASADHLLVSARLDRDDGPGLFLVPADGDGVQRRDWRSVDGQRMAELVLADAAVDTSSLLAGGDTGTHAGALLARAFDRGAAALVAETAGIAWALHETTLAYLGARRQFDVALSSLQALQHRMVDVYTDCEMCSSLAWVAAHGAADEDARARARSVSAAKSRSGRAALRVGAEAIQLHGGMGMTEELPVGHWYKRLTVINATLGDPAWHARRFRALADDPAPAA